MLSIIKDCLPEIVLCCFLSLHWFFLMYLTYKKKKKSRHRRISNKNNVLHICIIFLKSVELSGCPQWRVASLFIAFTRLIPGSLNKLSSLCAVDSMWWQICLQLVTMGKTEQFCLVILGCLCRVVLPVPFCCSTSMPQHFTCCLPAFLSQQSLYTFHTP